MSRPPHPKQSILIRLRRLTEKLPYPRGHVPKINA
jgi:hypothetical protein